jgi:hypothetical protein
MSKQLHRRGFHLIEFLIPEQRAVLLTQIH